MSQFVPKSVMQRKGTSMNRLGFVFLSGFMITFLFNALQRDPGYRFETVQSIYIDEISSHAINSNLAGVNWLESGLFAQNVDLNSLYQERAFVKKLADKSEVKKVRKSRYSYIEKRICPESPYFEKPVRAVMTSRYGYRVHPLSGRRHIHAGIDFRGKTGTPVYAASAGVVKTSRRKGAYGKTIEIDHGNRYSSLYGHLSDYQVKEGEWVNLGQTIGYVGRTGRATGPHLHFEVRCHNVPLNPRKYLGKINQIAEVKFRKRRSVSSIRSRRKITRKRRAPKRDSSYYTRMINLKKLKKLGDKQKKL
jgi:murein DD-endopeptidase MepM/ murein hydrolase activator NlpD